MAISPISITPNVPISHEVSESQSYGFKVADDTAAELIQIITQQKIEKITIVRETGKKLLKVAFKNKDAKLYAYMIHQVLEICVDAYRNGLLAEIQELLELDPIEARFWFQLLEERQLAALSFLMIITGELEKFSEDLEQDKNTILPFKKDVMRQMISFGITCTPPSIKKHIGLAEKMYNADVRTILAFISDAHFEYYYILDLPKEFAKFALQICRYMVDCNQDPKTQDAFLIELDLNPDELQLFACLMTSKNLSLFTWLLANTALSDFIREHNIPWSSMLKFQQSVYSELEQMFGKAFIKNDSTLMFKELIAAAEKEDEVAVNLSLFELKIHFITLFHNSQKHEIARFLLQAADLFLKNLEKPLFNLVKANFKSILRSSIEDYAFKIKMLGDTKVEGELAFILLDSLSLYQFGRACNMTAENLALFKEDVRKRIESQSGSYISTPQGLGSTIYCGLQEGSQNLLHLKNATSQLKYFLKLAFKLKDKEQYLICIHHISDLIEFVYKRGLLQKFFELSKIEMPFISRLSAAVESGDPKNITKFLIDYSLRMLIRNEDSHFLSNLGEWFKTSLAREKAIRSREKACLEFQKDLYKTSGIDIDPKNVGKIFRFQGEFLVLTEAQKTALLGTLTTISDKPKVKPDYKKILADLKNAIIKKDHEALSLNAAKIRDLLRAAFLEDHIPDFQVIMTGLIDCLKFGSSEKQEDKIATILDILSRSGYDIHETEVEYPYITAKELVFFLELLAHNNMPAVYFSLINYLNFKSFLEFTTDPIKINRICSFKIYAIEAFTKSKTLLSSSEVEKLMKICNELDLKNYREVGFGSDLLDLYTKYLILSSQIAGERERKAHSELLKMLKFEVSLTQKVHKQGMSSIFKLIFQRTNYKAQQLILDQKDPALLYWMIMSGGTDFQFFADRNGISQDSWSKLKRTLYGYIAFTLQKDEPEILRSKEVILQDFASLGKSREAILSHKNLDLLIFEAKALFKERFDAREVKDFQELLEALVTTIMPFDSNSMILSRVLELDAEELRDIAMILQHRKFELAVRYLLDCEELLDGPSGSVRYHRNERSDFRIAVIESFSKHQKCLLPDSAGALLKGNLDLVRAFDYDNTHYSLISLHIYFQLKDAYFSKNAAKFAEIINSICKFMEQIYQEGNVRALIHLFELHPEKFNDVPIFHFESGDTASKTVRIQNRTHLSLVDTMRRLIAKDRSGLAKHLVDHFIKKQEHSFIGIPNGTEFTLAVYQNLSIQPLDFLCLNKEINSREVPLIADNLRKIANLGTDLKKYEQTIEYLSKHGIIVNALHRPVDTDSFLYKELYKKMKQLWIEHRVAHRFGILDAELEGSFTTTMATELQTACQRFKTSSVCTKVLSEINSELKGISEKEWNESIERLSQDIKDIFIEQNAFTLATKLSKKELIAIPVFLQSEATDAEDWAHLTGALFFHYKKVDYCILSDRGGVISESDFGITIYKIAAPNNISDVASTLMCSEKSGMTLKDFRRSIDSLNLKRVYQIPKKHQKSGNCGWSSSAKMLGYGIKFVNILNLIGILNRERDDIAADFSEAQKLTQLLYKAFSNFDRKDILEQYQTDCSSYQITPNALLLAQILMRSEHRPQRKEIVLQIRSMNLIQDVHRETAFSTLLKASEYLLLHKTGLKKRGLEADRKLLSEHAKRLLEAYLAYKSEGELDSLTAEALKAMKDNQPELFKEKNSSDSITITVPLLLSGSLAEVQDRKPKSESQDELTGEPQKALSEAVRSEAVEKSREEHREDKPENRPRKFE